MHPASSLSCIALLITCLISSVLSAPRTRPPRGAVIVNKFGANGSYTTVQAGVDALAASNATKQYLFIYPGVYNEQVYIAPRNASLTIQGYTCDNSSYKGNQVNITYNLAQINVGTNDLTATVRAWATNLKVYNLNILNTFGHINSGGQNLALSAQATNQGYYSVALYGYQDTLLANTGLQIYAGGLILGAIDFIFGQRGQVWIDRTDIVVIAAGYITASGRSTDDNGWYVINNSSVRGVNASVEAQAGITYLGRPWRNHARVTFQNTFLSRIVSSVGWSIWSATDPRTDAVSLEEFGNTGEGSEGDRANFSTRLSEPRTVGDVLGSGWESQWFVDADYLS